MLTEIGSICKEKVRRLSMIWNAEVLKEFIINEKEGIKGLVLSIFETQFNSHIAQK